MEQENDYSRFAKLIASKLTKEELIKFAEVIDGDAYAEFSYAIQVETEAVAPEVFQ